jgi:hypothetical protein
MTEIRRQKTENRGQKTENRGQKIRGQKTENREWRRIGREPRAWCIGQREKLGRFEVRKVGLRPLEERFALTGLSGLGGRQKRDNCLFSSIN